MRSTYKMLAAGALIALTAASPALAGDPIRRIDILTRPQAVNPPEFQSAQLVAQEWRKLGLDVNVRAIPWEQITDVVWYNRETWDTGSWQMVGRPERSDPDEFIHNLFHSSTVEKGYNFIGYVNPEYDAVADAQRIEIDPEKRRELIFEAQEILARDEPNMMLAHSTVVLAYDKTVWDPASVVDQSGIGIRNTWTFNNITPLGDQKDIIVNSGTNLNMINPLRQSGAVDSWVVELLYDRLARVGPDGLPQPWAAESYEWVDDTTINVKLRSGMMWHDGVPLTAEDVKFTYDAAVSGEAPMYQPFASNVESIEIVDDTTLVFKLKQPSASFITSSFAKLNITPKHIWEPILEDLKTKPENAESYQEEMPVGSGPFKYVRWLSNEEVVLEAVPTHFQPPKAERFILRIVPNVEATLGMLRSGEINFLGDYPGDPQVLIDMAAEDGDLEIAQTIEMGFKYIAFNLRRAPFNDPAFRKALSRSVNRKLIVNAAYKGFAEESNSVISPALDYWRKPGLSDGFETGTDYAAKLLEDAGYELIDGRLHYPGDIKETITE
ncbi:ABC transporter substrate-binding protein [Mesorhizobium sp. CAU 1741]|uniref:ABC transporter substrate-binding protein n=1 Tax=Mesorhizobium sp. CAU 1741 TaxID=3140366 RepID=UPI00325ADB72